MKTPVGLALTREPFILQIIEDCTDILYTTYPLVSMSDQVSIHERHNFLTQHLVPFPELPVLFGKFVGNFLHQ